MDFLENEYKKRFQNQRLSDDKIDDEDLWAAIEENLENPSPKPAIYWDFLKKYRFAIAALMLLLCAVFVFQWVNSPKEIPVDAPNTVNYPQKQGLDNLTKKQMAESTPSVKQAKNSLEKPFENNNQNKIAENTPSVKQEKNSLETPFENNNQNKIAENTPSVNQGKNSLETPFENNNQNKIAENTPSVKQGKNSLETPFENNNQNKIAENTPSVKQGKNSLKTPFENNNQNKIAESTPSVNQHKNADLLPKKGLFEENNKKNKELSVTEKRDNAPNMPENSLQNQGDFQKDTRLPALSFLPFLECRIRSMNIEKPLLNGLSRTNNAPQKHKTQNIDWQLGISSGLNTMKMNYASDSSAAIATLKNQTEKGQLGWQSSAYLTVVRNDKWRFSTGLAYQQYYSKLDYKQEKTIQVLKKNQLLQVWINTSTGDTLQTRRGDTMINALSTREVVHHNAFQQLSIPLTVGIQNHRGNWIYGIHTGVVLNITLAQSGKLIDDKGEFQVFSNGDALAPLRKSSMGAEVSPFVGYSFTPKWSIECHPQWSWQVNKSIGTAKAQIHQFGLNLQSVWRF